MRFTVLPARIPVTNSGHYIVDAVPSCPVPEKRARGTQKKYLEKALTNLL